MHLLLKDRRFAIARARLSGYINDPYWCDTFNRGKDKELFWAINIEARSQEFDDEMWAPSIYHESLRFPVRNWQALEGQSLTWDSPFDQETGELNGGFYVVEHEAISRATLSIRGRHGKRFHIHWDGLCDVFWDDDFGENVPFAVDAEAEFEGIRVRGSEKDDRESLKARLAQYLDPLGLEQGPVERSQHKYDSGVGMSSCRFTPLE
jgi:hypothetical protein